MTVFGFWNNYGNLITLVGAFIFALTINRITIRRSTSIFDVLLGVILFLLVGANVYFSWQSFECTPPGSCEWSGLGYFVSLFAIATVSLIYLVLAIIMRFVVRRIGWPAVPSQLSWMADVSMGAYLLGMAGLGLMLAIVAMITFRSGLFVRWQRIPIPENIPPVVGVPPEIANLAPGVVEKAQEILFASQGNVIIQTDQRRVLSASVIQNWTGAWGGQMAWQVENGPPITNQRSYDRDCSLSMVVLPPPGRSIDRVRSRSCGFADYFQVEYAVLGDGSLWRWRNHIRLYRFLNGAVIVGPLAGFFVGLGREIRKK